jgi:hypothetical protein
VERAACAEGEEGEDGEGFVNGASEVAGPTILQFGPFLLGFCRYVLELTGTSTTFVAFFRHAL